MKKLLIMTCVLCIAILSACAAEDKNTLTLKQPPSRAEMLQHKKARDAAFEQKLGLTEEQKEKARELRKQGHEKMRPIVEQIISKKQEAKMVKLSKIAVQDQEAKLAVIDNEIRALEKQAHAIRKQNMKEFESILTSEQRKILKNMKKEGRKNFDKNHKHHPPQPF